MIEFPTFEAGKACFESDEYQSAIALREGNATFDIVIARGFSTESANAG